MRTHRLPGALALLLAGPLVLALAACSADSTPTVTAADFASNAATQIKDQLGTPVVVDCGAGDVALRVGTVTRCTLDETSTGLQYDVELTITSVTGESYNTSVKIGTPRTTSPTPGPSPTA